MMSVCSNRGDVFTSSRLALFKLKSDHKPLLASEKRAIIIMHPTQRHGAGHEEGHKDDYRVGAPLL